MFKLWRCTSLVIFANHLQKIVLQYSTTHMLMTLISLMITKFFVLCRWYQALTDADVSITLNMLIRHKLILRGWSVTNRNWVNYVLISWISDFLCLPSQKDLRLSGVYVYVISNQCLSGNIRIKLNYCLVNLSQSLFSEENVRAFCKSIVCRFPSLPLLLLYCQYPVWTEWMAMDLVEIL